MSKHGIMLNIHFILTEAGAWKFEFVLNRSRTVKLLQNSDCCWDDMLFSAKHMKWITNDLSVTHNETGTLVLALETQADNWQDFHQNHCQADYYSSRTFSYIKETYV